VVTVEPESRPNCFLKSGYCPPVRICRHGIDGVEGPRRRSCFHPQQGSITGRRGNATRSMPTLTIKVGVAGASSRAERRRHRHLPCASPWPAS
jgi:hypothetical protein